MKTLTQLAQLVDIHWNKPRTSFDLKIVYLENGDVAVKLAERVGMGPTVQDAIDDMCSASSTQSLMAAIMKTRASAIDATSVDLEAAKKAVVVAEKKLADQKLALQRLQSGEVFEQK